MDIYCIKIEYNADISALYQFLPEKKTDLDLTKKGTRGTVFAYALLALSLVKSYGITSPPTLGYTEYNKPYFLDRGNIHFSISHTDTHCLCALSRQPVGADIQTKRPISAGLADRVLAKSEDRARFFTYWALKESYIKLIGRIDRPLCEIEFNIIGDSAAFNNTHSYIFSDIPDCCAVVCTAAVFEKPEIINVSFEDLSCITDNRLLP